MYKVTNKPWSFCKEDSIKTMIRNGLSMTKTKTLSLHHGIQTMVTVHNKRNVKMSNTCIFLGILRLYVFAMANDTDIFVETISFAGF